jgi:hypothetical protein
MQVTTKVAFGRHGQQARLGWRMHGEDDSKVRELKVAVV